SALATVSRSCCSWSCHCFRSVRYLAASFRARSSSRRSAAGSRSCPPSPGSAWLSSAVPAAGSSCGSWPPTSPSAAKSCRLILRMTSSTWDDLLHAHLGLLLVLHEDGFLNPTGPDQRLDMAPEVPDCARFALLPGPLDRGPDAAHVQ